MKVRFYTLIKKVNSTKTAAPDQTYTEYDCILKSPTSEHDPVIEVQAAINASFNWVHIPDWDKFYFVKDAVSVANGLTDYYLTEDVLATYRKEIIGSKQYVAFASTHIPFSGDPEPWDKYKVDSRVSVSTTKVVSSVSQNVTMLSSVGSYILTVFNDSILGQSVGFGISYALDATNMGKLRNSMADPSVMQSLATYLGGSPLSSIYGCVWVPYVVTASEGTAVSSVQIGTQAFAVDAIRINGYVTASEGITLNITGLRDDFRRCEPYTSANLHLPGCGCIDLNLSDWVTATQIQITAIFEVVTGNMLYILRDPNGYIIQTASCSLAAQCPLGQMTVNTQGAVNAVGGFIGGAAALAVTNVNPALAAGAMLASGASAVLNMNKRAPSVSGHTGGRLNSLVKACELTIYEVQTEDPADSDLVALKGRPVGKVMQMNKVYGYVQCDGASVPIAGNATEIEEVNNFLNTGFFIETILP